ncbi:MAG: hypothetical protein JXN61_05235 [Sedimentisphaerales bacterium]|nr:hypothetical protein [Sedimentisphaerales bacterium]
MVALVIWIVLALLTAAVCLIVISAIRKPMNELLSANSCVSPARGFYVRSFCLIIFLAALGTIISAGGPCEEQSKTFMQGVWWILDGLSPVLWCATVSLGGYALLLTILFAVLGRYRDK